MTWRTVKLGDVCTIEKGNIGIMKAVPGEFPLVVLGEERRSHNEYQFDAEAVIIPLISSTGHGHRSREVNDRRSQGTKPPAALQLKGNRVGIGNELAWLPPHDRLVEFWQRHRRKDFA